ncbi:zinc ABC transporter substrate-binding protein [Francisellaceae bacterium]|nr:zinc ABC transporter substrate-binding protein [Francisellaceae bacterium]
MKKILLVVLFASIASISIAAPINKINVVSAENFYGSVINQIGGKYVDVTSILDNPNADPHLFSTSPKISIAITKAQIIVYNGIDYDSWMSNLINSQSNNNKLAIINVSELMGVKSGANPHIWYKPDTFPTFAKDITKKLISIEHSPEATAYFNENLKAFLHENESVQNKVAALKQKYQGTPVTATEPVFGYMADAIGLKMEGLDFQWKIMNDSEPTPQMLGKYQDNITNHKVKILFYNDQVTDPTTQNILNLAKKSDIPVVGVSETMPKHETVNEWLLAELNDTQKALESVKK